MIRGPLVHPHSDHSMKSLPNAISGQNALVPIRSGMALHSDDSATPDWSKRGCGAIYRRHNSPFLRALQGHRRELFAHRRIGHAVFPDPSVPERCPVLNGPAELLQRPDRGQQTQTTIAIVGRVVLVVVGGSERALVMRGTNTIANDYHLVRSHRNPGVNGLNCRRRYGPCSR